MEIIRRFDDAENNDNQPAEIGDWVTVRDPELQSKAAAHLDSDRFTVARVEGDTAYLVARTDYKRGMQIPIRPLEMRDDMPPVYGVTKAELQIEQRPRAVS